MLLVGWGISLARTTFMETWPRVMCKWLATWKCVANCCARWQTSVAHVRHWMKMRTSWGVPERLRFLVWSERYSGLPCFSLQNFIDWILLRSHTYLVLAMPTFLNLSGLKKGQNTKPEVTCMLHIRAFDSKMTLLSYFLLQETVAIGISRMCLSMGLVVLGLASVLANMTKLSRETLHSGWLSDELISSEWGEKNEYKENPKEQEERSMAVNSKGVISGLKVLKRKSSWVMRSLYLLPPSPFPFPSFPLSPFPRPARLWAAVQEIEWKVTYIDNVCTGNGESRCWSVRRPLPSFPRPFSVTKIHRLQMYS